MFLGFILQFSVSHRGSQGQHFFLCASWYFEFSRLLFRPDTTTFNFYEVKYIVVQEEKRNRSESLPINDHSPYTFSKWKKTSQGQLGGTIMKNGPKLYFLAKFKMEMMSNDTNMYKYWRGAVFNAFFQWL